MYEVRYNLKIQSWTFWTYQILVSAERCFSDSVIFVLVFKLDHEAAEAKGNTNQLLAKPSINV